MSDSEDDFMSDKFLPSCIKEDIRPGLLVNAQKRTHEMFKRKEQLKLKRPKTYHEQEKDAREKGLNTALSRENVGFKMMAKMGFKVGSGLGKSLSGLKEPIKIEMKGNSSGVGRENEVKALVNRHRECKNKNLTDIENKFKSINYERNLTNLLKRDFHKAQRICEELDFRNKVLEPSTDYFWTRDTLSKMKKKNQDNSDDEEEEEEEEKPEDISEEKLNRIINFLRDKYFYCIFCAVTGTDIEDLNSACPGPFRSDHDLD